MRFKKKENLFPAQTRLDKSTHLSSPCFPLFKLLLKFKFLLLMLLLFSDLEVTDLLSTLLKYLKKEWQRKGLWSLVTQSVTQWFCSMGIACKLVRNLEAQAPPQVWLRISQCTGDLWVLHTPLSSWTLLEKMRKGELTGCALNLWSQIITWCSTLPTMFL